MSSNTTQIVTGSFVSTGAPINLTIPSGVTWFKLLDVTNAGSSANPGVIQQAEWSSDMPAGAAYITKNTDGAATLTTSYVTSNGFTTFSNNGPEGVGALHSIAQSITQANPAVVNYTSQPYLNGQTVRIMNSVGMEQISGWDFTISNAATNSFKLAYLDSSGFSAPATSYKVCQVNPDWAWYPRTRLITKITQASSAVITMSVTHNLNVGQLVRIRVPSAFGMSQINGQVGQITAIDTTNNTITVNINSTGYTAFAFPTSAVAAAGDQWPMVVPIGEFPNTTNAAAFDNQGTMGLTLGSSVCGAASDQMYWIAYSGVAIS